MILSINNQTDEIIYNIMKYIEDKGYVYVHENFKDDPNVDKEYVYVNKDDETVLVKYIHGLSSNPITICHSVKDLEFWNDFFKDGCPKCKAKKLTPSSLMLYRGAPGIKNIIDNVNWSDGFGAYDRIGTIPPNWLCKRCGFEWGNLDELRVWSKRCKEGKELFDYSIVDWENRDKGLYMETRSNHVNE